MTELFHWSDDFSVGIEEIDAQHKELVDLLNQLHEAIHEHHGRDTSRAILDKLADYTRTHFAVEESLMRVSNYPEFAQHKQNHEDLIAQVHALQEKLDSGQAAITFELLHFLKVWLTRHINEADKRFGAFFITAGVSPQWSPEVKRSMEAKKWWWKFW
ncbi:MULTISPECIES: bacteriohemerythrin [Niveibacterium]|uniref:Hemerythrin family protein n=1 Tax=Niveibacterium microcysteis TaxID=2811415 RepID=A0ABX7M7U5_9RHOO|nr:MULTISPECIES: bacteriohemerythrin [Niveibacterium]QSI77826.1 hemerythrin family protein [Niveibacterium microcysteis]